MSRFMLYHGTVRPSDSYLNTHPDFEYDENDWFSDEYDLEDDDEILYMPRTCEKCGCTFTIYEAMSRYADRIDWPSYIQEYEGEYCGDCAADITDSKFNCDDL